MLDLQHTPDGINGRIAYKSRHFTTEDIDSMAAGLESALRHLAVGIDVPVSHLWQAAGSTEWATDK